MAAATVKCAKLGQELPGIDPETSDGQQAIRLATLLKGPEFAERVKSGVSQQAWEMWKDHMMIVMNEFRLDPTADESNAVLGQQMEAFLFGEQPEIPNYVPPEQQ